MYKNVLVAIDGSDTSALALKEAVSYAKEHPQSFLRIIHVIDINATPFYVSYAVTASSALSEYEKAIRSAGTTLLKKTESELHAEKVLNFETKLIDINKEDQRIYEKIADEANLWPANLIIIGTHGRRGFNRFFLGSVAEGLARIASVPVLLIRGKDTI